MLFGNIYLSSIQANVPNTVVVCVDGLPFIASTFIGTTYILSVRMNNLIGQGTLFSNYYSISGVPRMGLRQQNGNGFVEIKWDNLNSNSTFVFGAIYSTNQ